jgi:NhaP-type Na+/H+ or K+/H+ antiporter
VAQIEPSDVVAGVVLLAVAGYLAAVAWGRSPWHLPETPLEARQLGASALVFLGLALARLVQVLGVVAVVGGVLVLAVMVQRHRRGEAILFSLHRIRR